MGDTLRDGVDRRDSLLSTAGCSVGSGEVLETRGQMETRGQIARFLAIL